MTVTAERPAYSTSYVLPQKCDEWLQAVADHYADEGVPLPDRRYWTIGSTAHDCEQVVLCMQQMALGTTEQPLETVQCNGPRFVTFTIEVIRCVPAGDQRGRPPKPSAIEVASVNPVIDMEILTDCAKHFDEFMQGVVVTVDVIPSNGGMHGAIATYSVNL